jgi:hypothetical protein
MWFYVVKIHVNLPAPLVLGMTSSRHWRYMNLQLSLLPSPRPHLFVREALVLIRPWTARIYMDHPVPLDTSVTPPFSTFANGDLSFQSR